MQLVIKSIICKNICQNLYSRQDLYSRKTYIHASADDMVGKIGYPEKIPPWLRTSNFQGYRIFSDMEFPRVSNFQRLREKNISLFFTTLVVLA